jgi:hypothetical protein
MISTSGIFSTGEKKWMPMKFFGRFDALARPVIGSVEVLLANTEVFGMTASAFAVTSALMPRCSHGFDPDRRLELRSDRRLDARGRSACSWVRRPFRRCQQLRE